ncbi:MULTISPECIES: Rad52/Rad22 family DNA repair protein [unclassified Variovorax]|uniref:Rad52/Rad22 family DNA repair protein n=1 Tax=unclassified Variovorax TaxID=663243 RepID=UPI00076C7D27|nr:MULTISPECIES: Rad52/Rad22 family DNA repair protein [unclassified Variovorax]KWT98371.1 Phage essential recombination function protein, Erf [Variovorax sp. WDL1]PNG49970.1 Single-stranded DNA-binding protein DdrA [Variovorax sp. B2]PNG50842.1 Single-stranded DNA-binding protein DdrA [Variovorax sp. B4]VTU41752.1 DNA damage response protein A [Variovorax sp. PBL-H6]VTU44560.1 DNA damage response protein A [Variovorax sp. SRS16]
MDTKQIIANLQAFFPASAIKWRAGKKESERRGLALPYIDARDVQARLDAVVGAQGWEVTMKPSSVGVIAGIKILLDGHWVLKEDGAQFDSFKDNDAKELAIKGAFSDGFKRAAVMWGIGRYLYAFEAPVVDLDENGELVSTPTLPPQFLPEADREAAIAQAQAGATSSKTTDTAAEVPAQANPVAEAKVTPVAEVKAMPPVTESVKVAETKPKETKVQKTSAPVPDTSADDERRARADALADSAAGQDTGSKAAAANDSAAGNGAANDSGTASTAPAGAKVVAGFDYGHLTLSDAEEGFVKDILVKVPKFPYEVLKKYLDGDKAKQKVNETAMKWLLKCLDEENARKKAA